MFFSGYGSQSMLPTSYWFRKTFKTHMQLFHSVLLCTLYRYSEATLQPRVCSQTEVPVQHLCYSALHSVHKFQIRYDVIAHLECSLRFTKQWNYLHYSLRLHIIKINNNKVNGCKKNKKFNISTDESWASVWKHRLMERILCEEVRCSKVLIRRRWRIHHRWVYGILEW